MPPTAVVRGTSADGAVKLALTAEALGVLGDYFRSFSTRNSGLTGTFYTSGNER